MPSARVGSCVLSSLGLADAAVLDAISVEQAEDATTNDALIWDANS